MGQRPRAATAAANSAELAGWTTGDDTARTVFERRAAREGRTGTSCGELFWAWAGSRWIGAGSFETATLGNPNHEPVL